jgi:hypothetical protein
VEPDGGRQTLAVGTCIAGASRLQSGLVWSGLVWSGGCSHIAGRWKQQTALNGMLLYMCVREVICLVLK